MIPKVQRDYAYGRQETKVKEVLDGMLTTMLNAVANDSVEIFDFVYGGSFVKKNDNGAGLIPLDGQQRLTTLFLLHWYASIVQPIVDDQEDNQLIHVDSLLKFRYETRQSATDFLEALVGDIRNDIKPLYSSQKKIKDMILDNPKYLPSYDSDPTIISMLNVLEQIEIKCREYSIDNLWSKLTTRDNIQFYSLSLDKFGLTDDLYIKMNSRGKKLTEFEIFKSDLEKAIKRISPDLKDEISIKIDNAWMDIMWTYAQSSNDDSNIVKKADEGFMQMFKNIFRLELFRRKIEVKTNRQASLDEIITDEDSIKQIISIFDTMSGIQKTIGIADYWNHFKRSIIFIIPCITTIGSIFSVSTLVFCYIVLPVLYSELLTFFIWFYQILQFREFSGNNTQNSILVSSSFILNEELRQIIRMMNKESSCHILISFHKRIVLSIFNIFLNKVYPNNIIIVGRLVVEYLGKVIQLVKEIVMQFVFIDKQHDRTLKKTVVFVL